MFTTRRFVLIAINIVLIGFMGSMIWQLHRQDRNWFSLQTKSYADRTALDTAMNDCGYKALMASARKQIVREEPPDKPEWPGRNAALEEHRQFAQEMKAWHEKFGKDTKQRQKENKAHFEAQRPMWREAENCLQQLGFVRSTNPLAQEHLKKTQPSSD